MSKSGNKYHIPENEAEILPNLLGLTTAEKIGDEEFEGFYRAQQITLSGLTETTVFDLEYIYQLHKLALGHLYSFAGNLRTVNISKGGFLFPTAQFLPDIMESFQKEILDSLPNTYSSKDDLIKDIAQVHGELLFIHPFREGNGRTARILASLMARKHGYNNLIFTEFQTDRFDEYVYAVQQVAIQNYEPMKGIIRTVFSS